MADPWVAALRTPHKGGASPWRPAASPRANEEARLELAERGGRPATPPTRREKLKEGAWSNPFRESSPRHAVAQRARSKAAGERERREAVLRATDDWMRPPTAEEALELAEKEAAASAELMGLDAEAAELAALRSALAAQRAALDGNKAELAALQRDLPARQRHSERAKANADTREANAAALRRLQGARDELELERLATAQITARLSELRIRAGFERALLDEGVEGVPFQALSSVTPRTPAEALSPDPSDPPSPHETAGCSADDRSGRARQAFDRRVVSQGEFLRFDAENVDDEELPPSPSGHRRRPSAPSMVTFDLGAVANVALDPVAPDAPRM